MQNSGRWLHGQDSKGGECGLMSNLKILCWITNSWRGIISCHITYIGYIYVLSYLTNILKVFGHLKIFLYQSIVDLQGCFHFRGTIKDSVMHIKIWKKFKAMK